MASAYRLQRIERILTQASRCRRLVAKRTEDGRDPEPSLLAILARRGLRWWQAGRMRSRSQRRRSAAVDSFATGRAALQRPRFRTGWSMGSTPGAPSKLKRRSPPRTGGGWRPEPGPGGRRRQVGAPAAQGPGATRWLLRDVPISPRREPARSGERVEGAADGFAKISARPRHLVYGAPKRSWSVEAFRNS